MAAVAPALDCSSDTEDDDVFVDACVTVILDTQQHKELTAHVHVGRRANWVAWLRLTDSGLQRRPGRFRLFKRKRP